MTDNLLDQQEIKFEDMVGEGKRWKDPDTLLKSKLDSDEYVKTLEQRMDEMREDYTRVRDENVAKAKLEEYLDQVKAQQLASNNAPQVKEVQQPGIDPKEIESLVSTKILEHEVSKRQTENYNLVKDKLQELYGKDYQTVLKKQIDAVGLTEEDVNSLARKSPIAFFKTIGLDQPQRVESFQAPPRSSSQSFMPKTKKRTWSYYQEMRKTNPKLYWEPKTAVQMHNDAVELGEDFKDGDWSAV